MKLKLHWILTLFGVLSMQISLAQERNVSGVVSGDAGAIPGVNVVVKGTKNSTQTDFDGKYSIKAKTGDVLLFSYVGMSDKTVAVGTSDKLNVTLDADTKSLDEVVVVAYGKQQAKAIVGSVATIKSDVLEKQQATNVLTALQGSVAGVNVIAAGGQPGEDPVIRIRGISSISSSASPLIILDGATFTGSLNSISSDQVESMTVLKDAASSALYGSRAANGVILITTKKGKFNSAPKVSFTTMVGVASNAVKFHDLLGSDDYMKLTWEAMRNTNQYIAKQSPEMAGINASNGLISRLKYNPYTVANPVDANGNLVSTEKKWDSDWEDIMTNDAAVRSEHTLSFSGGSENTRYNFTSNYLSQEGNVVTSKFDRITTRLSVDSKINNWLKTGISMFYATSDQNFPLQGGSFAHSTIQWVYLIPSIYPLYQRDADGNLVKDAKGQNIFDYGSNSQQIVNGTRPQAANENAYGALFNYKFNHKRDNFTANAYLEFTLTKDLIFKTNLAYDKFLYDTYSYNSNEFGAASINGGSIYQGRDITTSINFINSLNYKKSFNKHHFSIDLIQESFSKKIDRLGAEGKGFLTGIYVLNGSTTPTRVSGYIDEDKLSSYLARIAYNFDEKYFLESSFRRDGSSRFGSDVRWGNFYSVGGSWLISNENFLKENKVISELKLRASYGELGNNDTNGYFPYLQGFNTGQNELDNTGVVLSNVTDPLLTWEKTSSKDIGLDFGFFNSRITGTVDYYYKKSIDLIVDKPLPRSTGSGSIITNDGGIKNYGWEFLLNSKNIKTPSFDWNTSLNFSFDKNEFTSLTQDGVTSGNKRWEVGHSIYDFYMQEWAGVNPTNGYGMWYKDVIGADGQPTGEKTTTEKYTEATRSFVGKSSLPDVIGGFTNYFRYKNIDLNILFNFSFGSYVYDNTYANLMEGFETSGRTSHADIQDRWQKPGDVTDVPLLLASSNDFNSVSTRFLYKNDYIRLKALNFGYNLPQSVLDKTKLSKLRLYFQADNLWTYQTHKGIDPEQDFAGETGNRSYSLRIMSVGFNLEF